MKKFTLTLKYILAIAVLAALIFSLTSDILNISFSVPPISDGDSNNDNDDTQNPNDTPGNDDPDENKDPAKPDETIPNWSIKSNTIKNSVVNEKGHILCEARYIYPYAESNDGSDIHEFSNALSNISNEIHAYVNSRCNIYKIGTYGDFSVPPQITGYYSISRFSSEIFSISFTFSETTPDGMVRETKFSYNLDLLLSSSEITLDAVMNDAVGSVKNILKEKKNLTLLSTYESILESVIDSSWSITPEGILFSFDAGTICPVSYGNIDILINKSELSSQLSEYGKILLNISV